MSEELGNYILQARTAKKLTQGALGKFFGKSQPTVSDIEAGKVGIDKKHVPAVAKALGVPVNELMRIAGHWPGDDSASLAPNTVRESNGAYYDSEGNRLQKIPTSDTTVAYILVSENTSEEKLRRIKMAVEIASRDDD